MSGGSPAVGHGESRQLAPLGRTYRKHSGTGTNLRGHLESASYQVIHEVVRVKSQAQSQRCPLFFLYVFV